MPERKRHVIPSSPDDRDYRIARFVPGLDEVPGAQFMLPLPGLNVILDQGSIGSCVAHSLATCKSILEYRGTNKWPRLCAMMLYGHRRPGHHRGPGMQPREALHCLLEDGMWLERDFGFRQEVPALYANVERERARSPELNARALGYAICGYARLRTADDIKRALRAGMPVTGSWELYPSFKATGRDGKAPLPGRGERVEGYHQMTIAGWAPGHWAVINSWGVDFAHKGMYYIPLAYMPYEAWGVSDSIFPAGRKAREVVLTVGSRAMLVDGEARALDAAPQIIGGRAFLPVRAVAEALGAAVEWHQPTKSVTVRSGEAELIMQAGSRRLTVDRWPAPDMDVAPVIADGRALLPIRHVAERLNCTVGWDAAARSVTIRSK